MSTIAQSLYQQICSITDTYNLPAVDAFHLSPQTASDKRRNNFAYLQLSDGTIGITYVALDDALKELNDRLPQMHLRGMSAVELAAHYLEPAAWQRALGLAAINAISQFMLKQQPDIQAMPENMVALAPGKQEHIGLVGYFGRLVDPLRESGAMVTVIELDKAMVQSEPGLEVTLDATQLVNCTQVIITGTTLLNHSLDRMLSHCQRADRVFVLGPSASCLPQALFDAGVTTVGGFQVTDPALFTLRWKECGRWRDAGLRYSLDRP